MQWSIRIYECVTTFLHGLLWFTGLLFLSGHAASAVGAGYYLTNVCSHAARIIAMDLGHMGWQELLALASIPSGLLALTAYIRRMSVGACGPITATMRSRAPASGSKGSWRAATAA
jgi:hypothetical protein